MKKSFLNRRAVILASIFIVSSQLASAGDDTWGQRVTEIGVSAPFLACRLSCGGNVVDRIVLNNRNSYENLNFDWPFTQNAECATFNTYFNIGDNYINVSSSIQPRGKRMTATGPRPLAPLTRSMNFNTSATSPSLNGQTARLGAGFLECKYITRISPRAPFGTPAPRGMDVPIYSKAQGNANHETHNAQPVHNSGQGAD